MSTISTGTQLPAEPTAVRSTPRRGTLAIAAAGTFLALAAYSLPLSDFATVATALAAGPAAQTWILSSMSVGLTAALLLSGTLADRYGRRLLFLIGAAVLAAGSGVAVVAAVIKSPLQADAFIAARIIEGSGGAAVVASALALLAVTFPEPRERAAASSVWGAALGAGIAIGPVGAAVAHQAGHWWLAYLALAVLTVLLIMVARRGVTESRSGGAQRPDLIGTGLFLAATLLALVGLVALRTSRSPVPPVITIGVAVLLYGVFVINQLRGAEPMLDPRLFRRRRFAAAHLAGLVVGFGSVGLMSLVCTYATIVMRLNVWQTTGLVVVWAGVSTITAVAARWLPAWFTGGRQLGWGLLVIGAGQLILMNASTVPPMIIGLFVAGLAVGVVNAGLGRETAASAPEGRSGLGSGVNNTARYLGAAVGVTVSATLLLHGGPSVGQLITGWNAAVIVCSAVAAAGGIAVLLLGRRA